MPSSPTPPLRVPMPSAGQQRHALTPTRRPTPPAASATYSRVEEAAVPEPRRAGDDLTLVALPTAVNLAGWFAAHTVTEWGMPTLAKPAQQAAAELTRRAVATTGITEIRPHWTEVEDLHPIRVCLQWTNACVVLEVHDSDPTPPAPATPPAVSLNGVRWRFRLHDNGKAVWCELPIPHRQPPPAPSPATP